MTETKAQYGHPMKQLNIRLPANIHRQLKAKCVLDDLSMAQAVEYLAREYLAGNVKIA